MANWCDPLTDHIPRMTIIFHRRVDNTPRLINLQRLAYGGKKVLSSNLNIEVRKARISSELIQIEMHKPHNFDSIRQTHIPKLIRLTYNKYLLFKVQGSLKYMPDMLF